MSQRFSAKFETLVIAIFCIAFVMWAWSKCTAKKAELQAREDDDDEEIIVRQPKKDTVKPAPVIVQQPAPPPPPMVGGTPVQRPGSPQNATSTTSQPAQNQPVTQNPAPTQVVRTDAQTVLYSAIDGLKVRKEPGLKSASVDKIKLHEEVYFLNQKTDWEEELSLSYNLPAVKDRWVKIRTKRGKEGWVFGAGVHYYKKKVGDN
jgi:type IV secretory pathway VirB10-like protein